MSDLEFYRDEEGNPCVRGEDERLATFIQTDLQGSIQIVSDLIARLEDEGAHSEFHGNAYSLNISSKTVTIEANFDDEAPDRRIERDDMLRALNEWRAFVKDGVTHS